MNETTTTAPPLPDAIATAVVTAIDNYGTASFNAGVAYGEDNSVAGSLTPGEIAKRGELIAAIIAAVTAIGKPEGGDS